MKQLATVIFACIVMLSFSAQAQKYRLGMTFSPQVQWSGIDNIDFGTDGLKVSRSPNLGFMYGLEIDSYTGPSENYVISTGFQVIHSYRNYEYSTELLVGNENYDKTYRTTFVGIPLGFKMMTNEIGYARYFANFGSQLDFRVRSREDYSGPGEDYKNEDSDEVNFFNPSLNIGIGTEYNLFANTSAIIGIYYTNGFLNMIKDGDDERIIFRSLSLKMGIMF